MLHEYNKRQDSLVSRNFLYLLKIDVINFAERGYPTKPLQKFYPSETCSSLRKLSVEEKIYLSVVIQMVVARVFFIFQQRLIHTRISPIF